MKDYRKLDQKQFTKEWKKEFSDIDVLDKYGIEIKSGWFNLIWRLSETIDAYHKTNMSKYIRLRVVQVKQKFGGLRYYVDFKADKFTEEDEKDITRLMGMIWFAESLSFSTCEVCGEPGERTNELLYVQTLCPKHLKEISKKSILGAGLHLLLLSRPNFNLRGKK